MDKFLEILPKDILSKGIPLQDGFIGTAFYATEMLKISKILLKNSISALGGDVLILSREHAEYSPNGESWYLNYNNDKDYYEFVKESLKKMDEYIINLDKSHPSFLYVATLANKEMFESLKI